MCLSPLNNEGVNEGVLFKMGDILLITNGDILLNHVYKWGELTIW